MSLVVALLLSFSFLLLTLTAFQSFSHLFPSQVSSAFSLSTPILCPSIVPFCSPPYLVHFRSFSQVRDVQWPNPMLVLIVLLVCLLSLSSTLTIWYFSYSVPFSLFLRLSRALSLFLSLSSFVFSLVFPSPSPHLSHTHFLFTSFLCLSLSLFLKRSPNLFRCMTGIIFFFFSFINIIFFYFQGTR